jgi:hypothetical protein
MLESRKLKCKGVCHLKGATTILKENEVEKLEPRDALAIAFG